MNIIAAAIPMIAVATHPSATMTRPEVKRPIADVLDAINIMIAINGTATMPLITALQNSAFIGLIGEYWIINPANTLTAITE